MSCMGRDSGNERQLTFGHPHHLPIYGLIIFVIQSAFLESNSIQQSLILPDNFLAYLGLFSQKVTALASNFSVLCQYRL